MEKRAYNNKERKQNSSLLFVCGEPLTTQVFAAIDA